MVSSPKGVRRRRAIPFGAEITDHGVRFRLWAPRCHRIDLKIETEPLPRPMTAAGGGWHELLVPQAGAGTLYRFRLPGGLDVPDPASRHQPSDVHGPSEVIDPGAYVWGDAGWRARPWEECIVYELHVGAFTPEGTFSAAAARLDFLRDLGITAIELMPVAEFPGRWSWGYDGVLPFAPDASYGRPEDLKALIDAAHRRGIAMLLDVVYNHFGPDGNYLPSYAPVFTERHQTPWGAAINFDGEGSKTVRELVVENALYWIEEFNFDGLRLDAVHAILDDSPEPILEEIARRVRQAAGGRQVHLVLENLHNEASLLRRDQDRAPAAFTAQWNDDLHHALHTAASGERAGYYRDYAGDTRKLGRALAEGFAFQGEIMEYLGKPRGEPSAGLPPTAFVGFIQNHDQVGNRAFGERLTAIAAGPAVRAIAAIYLLAPQIPMIFMGEEWGADEPFAFFCDFGGALREAVRRGRLAEFAKFPEFRDPDRQRRIPDPAARGTFLSAKLDWAAAERVPHAQWLAFYRALLALRRKEIIPRLKGIAGNCGQYKAVAGGAVLVRWTLGDGSRLRLAANLSAVPRDGFGIATGRQLYAIGSVEGGRLGAWSVVWSLDDV